jgi:hypothetical protein
MDEEMTKIWKLIGALSDARWRRATQPGVSPIEVLFAEPYRPESAEERAIWTELTAPHNYLALKRYVESRKESGTNEFAAKLHEALLAEATIKGKGTGVAKGHRELI